MRDGYVGIPCFKDTRDDVVRPLKRGNQTYDELLRAMAEQYDPEAEA